MESVNSSTVTPSSGYSKGSTYSGESWSPTKGSIVSSTQGTKTSNTMTTLSVDRKPEGRLKIRTLCLLGKFL
jgi:hypothetical protein